MLLYARKYFFFSSFILSLTVNKMRHREREKLIGEKEKKKKKYPIEDEILFSRCLILARSQIRGNL